MSKGRIDILGPTAVSGGFNVIGICDDRFHIQGHLSLEQLKELRDECNKVLKANGAK